MIVIDLPNTILKLLQASLFPFHFTSKLVFLSKILTAFPLLVKKRNTMAGGTLEAIARKLTKPGRPGLRGQSLAGRQCKGDA